MESCSRFNLADRACDLIDRIGIGSFRPLRIRNRHGEGQEGADEERDQGVG